jgi:hypothetical protein
MEDAAPFLLPPEQQAHVLSFLDPQGSFRLQTLARCSFRVE